MKVDEAKLDRIIDVAKSVSGQSYYCKWCKRHIEPDEEVNPERGLLFVHDDVYHPPDCIFDSGNIHVIQ